MSGWHDPPHEQVRLTPSEIRAVEHLEQVFYERRRRFQLERFAPWLVPLGAVIMLVALPSSLLISAIGALLTGLGMAALLRSPRRWRTYLVARARARRRL